MKMRNMICYIKQIVMQKMLIWLYMIEKSKIYDKTDDYVILNLRDKLYYNILIEQRGKESVSQRESFLGVPKN